MERVQSIPTGLTYDDVLLVPIRSAARSRKDVSTRTKFSKNLELAIPIVASNMDTVCEADMAVAMARAGGIGVLHRFCSMEEQIRMVTKVKKAQSLRITEPREVHLTATREEALTALNWEGKKGAIRSLMVLGGNKEVHGIVTVSDLQLAEQGRKVSDLMTPVEKLVMSTNANISLHEAKEILHRHRISNLPVVDNNKRLLFLVTASDVKKRENNKVASLDRQGRLVVAAAVGVKGMDEKRAERLVETGADALVIDIAHGHSDICIDMLRKLKKNPVTRRVDIVAGNIASADAARDLIQAGADGLKVGVGPGSICITRLVAGSGVPQLTALFDVSSVAHEAGIPIIADGGIKLSGDISKALAAGANTVMLGNMLSGTDESPGTVLVKDGKKVKIIRGMAGYGANISKAERESLDDDVFMTMIPEGVEGNVPYKGPVSPILHQLVGGLRSGISYCGATNLLEMRAKAKFVRMTGAGLRESGPHDISKL